jgi:hypothetical protein
LEKLKLNRLFYFYFCIKFETIGYLIVKYFKTKIHGFFKKWNKHTTLIVIFSYPKLVSYLGTKLTFFLDGNVIKCWFHFISLQCQFQWINDWNMHLKFESLAKKLVILSNMPSQNLLSPNGMVACPIRLAIFLGGKSLFHSTWQIVMEYYSHVQHII